MKRHILGLLAVIAAVAAIAAVAGTTSAHATGMSCTWTDNGNSVGDANLNVNETVNCSGTTGYTVKLIAKCNAPSGVGFGECGQTAGTYDATKWPDGTVTNNPFEQSLLMPAESCGTPNDKYADSSQHALQIALIGTGGNTSCGVDTSNQHAVNNYPQYDAVNNNGLSGRLCIYNWRFNFTAKDVGTGATVVHNYDVAAAPSTC